MTSENVDFTSIVYSVILKDGNIAEISLLCIGSIDQNTQSLTIKFSIDMRISTEGVEIDFPEDLALYRESDFL